MSAKAWVYRLFDSEGQLLYVGSTLTGYNRLTDHRRGPWGDTIASVTVEVYETKELAAARESAVILAEHPRWNVRGKWDKLPVVFVEVPKAVESTVIASSVPQSTGFGTDAARALRAQRKGKEPKPCAICDVVFKPGETKQLYCSAACRYRARANRKGRTRRVRPPAAPVETPSG